VRSAQSLQHRNVRISYNCHPVWYCECGVRATEKQRQMNDHTSGIQGDFGNDDGRLAVARSYTRLLLIAERATGGAGAVRLTRDLTERGAAVHVVVPTWGPDVAAYREAGATVHFYRTTLPLARPWHAARILHHLRLLIRQIDPQIVYPLHASTAIALRLACGSFRPAESPRHLRDADDASPRILSSRPRWQAAQIIPHDHAEQARMAAPLRLVASRHDTPVGIQHLERTATVGRGHP
jgi:hypothetical protein